MHPLTIHGEIAVPPTPGARERRRRPRHLCEAPAVATIPSPEKVFRGTIRNISEAGCYFETPARLSLALASTVDLRFRLSDRRYSTRALVRNLIPGRGMGLEFNFSGGRELESIRSLIRTLETASLAKSL
jgi:hypothetical protein